jgi:hypothetical protein
MKAPYLFAIIALVITFAALSLPNLKRKSVSPVATKDEAPATSLYAANDISSTATNASYLDNKLELLQPPDGAQTAAAENGIIDPDKSFFGVPLGTSEDRLIKKFGEPVGYLRLTDNRSLMLYGDTMAFIFQSGKLSGILLRDKDWGFLDARLKQELPSKNSLGWPKPPQPWDNPKPWDNQWELNNGLKNKMGLVDIRGILGDSLQPEEPTSKNSRHWQYYLTDKSKVSLGFLRTGHDNEDDENAYWLYSVSVEPRQEKD